MKASDFVAQAEQLGDFYLYYAKEGAKGTTYLVGTTDLDNKFIKANMVMPKTPLTADEVLVWSWSSAKLRVMNVTKIKRLIGLATVLKNNVQ